MRKSLFILFPILFALWLVACSPDNTEIAQLQVQLSSAESRIEFLEEQEELRRENDAVIYLRDTHNFVANGIVSLGHQKPYDKVHKDFSKLD